ncbi:hypothetical protein ACFFRR_004857 [Megaselia abdita]
MMANSVQEREDEGPEKFFHDKDRGRWGSKTEFFLSCVGYAVGIGNVLRFPYLCYRSGGGAFLVPYLLMLFLCGIPLFFMEMVIGQFSSTGCVGMFRMCPLFKGAGYAIIVINFISSCFYSILLSYPLLFLTKIFSNELPWVSCGHEWNTEKCIDVSKFSLYNHTSIKSLRTPSDEFFHEEILKISPGINELGGIVWPLFYCLCISWLTVYVCIIKGIKTVGKVVYFTATFPYVILFILFIRGITLPGAMRGIIFYIKPEWSKLMDLKVWTDAAIQIFFSLGPGWGGIVNMASFNKVHNDAKKDAILIPIINCSTSIFAGFVVFSVLGFLSHQSGIPVAEVATSGPGLAFITYPQAIAMMPWPHLWAALFFFMLYLLGLDSAFVQIEAFISSMVDEFPSCRPYKFAVTFSTILAMFFISIIFTTEGGMYVYQLLDWYSASISVILVCVFEVIMVAWMYGNKRFSEDIFFMVGSYPGKMWTICWKFITPIILIAIFFTTIAFNRDVSYNGIEYPRWAINFGWSTCAASILFIPGYMFYIILKGKSPPTRMIAIYSKANDWTPALDEDKAEYEKFRATLNKSKVKTFELKVVK